MSTVSTNRTAQIIDRRYDLCFLFDVTDGNPNGDPDAGNLPRLDPESLQGLVSDVCLKRKIRNAIAAMTEGRPGFNIYFQTQDATYGERILNLQHQKAYDALGYDAEGKDAKDSKQKADRTAEARRWMCGQFFDIRAFGAVMTTGDVKFKCGQVRGPFQITFARSVDPIVPMEVAITRKSVTTEDEANKQSKKDGFITGTMGRKSTIPYALYLGHGFVNPLLAKDTGFNYGDLKALVEAMLLMFELDRSASRGLMTLRKLIIFEHGSKLGNAPAHVLFDLLSVAPRGAENPARKYSDYAAGVHLDRESLPAGVNVYDLPEERERFLADVESVA